MAQLTPAELQEINRFLDAGKSLPDKYRFLIFDEKREIELVWNGKTNEVTNAVLPFQVIEQVDEPRAEIDTKLQMSMFDIDERGRQLKGWQNKLIWGDNKLVLSSLKNGSLREEIENQGGIKLIYIDPPFDFSDTEIQELISKLHRNGSLKDDAFIAVERTSKAAKFSWPEGFSAARERNYGAATIYYGNYSPE